MPEIKKTPMWFAHPADRWLQALPVGNGRLGAMVFGGAARERLHLTESTLWSGAAAVRDLNPAARESIPAIRNLFFAGRYTEAEELCRKNLLAGKSIRYCFADGIPGDRNDSASRDLQISALPRS